MIGKLVAFSTIAATALLVLLVNATTPTTAGPLGILAFFVLLYVALLGALAFLLYGASRVMARLGKAVAIRRPLGQLSFVKAYYYGTVLALGPLMIVGMLSVSEFGALEVGLVMVFVVLGCIYVARRT